MVPLSNRHHIAVIVLKIIVDEAMSGWELSEDWGSYDEAKDRVISQMQAEGPGYQGADWTDYLTRAWDNHNVERFLDGTSDSIVAD